MNDDAPEERQSGDDTCAFLNVWPRQCGTLTIDFLLRFPDLFLFRPQFRQMFRLLA
jgi:hypothetical protein